MDGTEFKKLFLPLHKELYQTAFRMTNNSMDAEDMVQETYLRLWNRRHELSDVENAGAFARTTIRNLCLNMLRDGKKNEGEMPDMSCTDLAMEQSLQHETEMRDEAELMRHIIAGLPEKERYVIMSRIVNGDTFEEISERTGLNVLHIRVLLSRARKKLCKRFNEYMNYEHK